MWLLCFKYGYLKRIIYISSITELETKINIKYYNIVHTSFISILQPWKI
jgi:hypothetical protein